MSNRRMPAEWEPQDGVLLAWPHLNSDWHDILKHAEDVFINIIVTISRFERVILVAPDAPATASILEQSGTVPANIRICTCQTNDTWARDFGPIAIIEDDKPLLLNFIFNGWGLKFAANLDNQINKKLLEDNVFSVALKSIGLALEGGSIESDGQGTILTTAECLLNPNRNPHLDRQEIETALGEILGADRFLWLENGFLAGDDTDSHIDTLARLCPDDTILYISCNDPEDAHFHALNAMAAELQEFRTRDNRPFRLIPLPWPSALYDENGERLPATYANFLVINGAVLVPTYADSQDEAALEVVRQAYPDREIIGIDCRTLIKQHGSLHCVTMQLPKGVLS